MKKLSVMCFVVVVGILLIAASLSIPGKKVQDIQYPQKTEKAGVKTSANMKLDLDFGKIPLYFIPNKGQVDERVKFYAKTSRFALWMTKKGLVFDSVRQAEVTHSPHSPGSLHRDVARLIFLDSNPDPGMMPVEMTPHNVNYFKGNDPSKWQTGIPTSRAVLYSNIYKGIDLKIYGVEKEVEYDWIVKPGADPGRIRFKYANNRTRIDNRGNLIVDTEHGNLMHKKPVSYQQIEGERIPVDAAFEHLGGDTYGVTVKEYNRDYELVIDPILVYSTFLGGVYHDHINDIAVDNDGNIYAVGTSNSHIGFPLSNAYQGSGETFIIKLVISPSASYLASSTFIGGRSSSAHDTGYAIAVDNDGFIYVTGSTKSPDFPAKYPFQKTLRGTEDAFVIKMDLDRPGGNMILFSTYLGGEGTDSALDIDVDDYGFVYVTGTTGSNHFPTRNAYQTIFGPRAADTMDAFIAKLDTTQIGVGVLVYSSYLTSLWNEAGTNIAVDNNGNAYVAGYTNGLNFPIKKGYKDSLAGDHYLKNNDVFLCRIDTAESGNHSLVYSTYLGGEYTDMPGGVAVDNDGNAYITGYTTSPDFPTRDPYQSYWKGGTDVFVTKIDTNKTGNKSLVYSTFLGGGSGNEGGKDIAVDTSGNIYVAGYTFSENFPVVNPLTGQETFGGYQDAFITKFNPLGDYLLFSTYLKGESYEVCNCITLDDSNKIYVGGCTHSSDFQLTSNAFQPKRKGRDGFIVVIEQ